MSEERSQDPQEPAEGAEDAEEAPGFERAGDDGGMHDDDEGRSVEHPQEPAARPKRSRRLLAPSEQEASATFSYLLAV